MKLSLVIDPRAGDEIQAHHDWWAEHRSAAQAGRWYDRLSKVLVRTNRVVQHPANPESSYHPFEIRELLFGLGRRPSHRVLFTIRPDCVYILSVRHVSQEPLGPDDLP
jgi:hypothetical protein